VPETEENEATIERKVEERILVVLRVSEVF